MTRAPAVWDAVVVGSGPAGATAAQHLAGKGKSVLILERETWPRYKTCGGGLVERARRLLEVDVSSAIEVETHRAELHFLDSDLSFSVDRDRPLVSMTMRSDLDGALLDGALEAGARMETSICVDGIEQRTSELIVKAGERLFRTRFLIAADGAAGACATLGGWASHQHLIPAIESEIRVDSATRRRFLDVARFDFGLVPSGYAWVFPKRDGLSVGCLSYRRNRPQLKEHLGRYLRRLEIEPLESETHGFVIPVAPRARRLAAGRILLTGDSAGLADPVTCEGISHAILSGDLAARAIALSDARPESVAATYQTSLERTILRELRHARVLSRILYRAPRFRRIAFRRLGQPLSDAMVDVISGKLTYRQLLSSPSRYLRAVRIWLNP